MSLDRLDHMLDHVEQGLDRLLDQYKGKPRIAGWIKAYLRQVQQLEDAAYDVLIKRLIDNAKDVQLDMVGRIVGELREGRDDDFYRVCIYARVRINRSRGNVDDVLAVLALITVTPVVFHEYRNACLSLTFLAVTEYDPVAIFKPLSQTKAGGVKFTMIVPTTNSIMLLPMTWDGTSDPNFAVGDANALDVSFGLASDVVTLRDPRLPFPSRPGPPVINYIEPSFGPEA
jgi:hypothetical protein